MQLFQAYYEAPSSDCNVFDYKNDRVAVLLCRFQNDKVATWLRLLSRSLLSSSKAGAVVSAGQEAVDVRNWLRKEVMDFSPPRRDGQEGGDNAKDARQSSQLKPNCLEKDFL